MSMILTRSSAPFRARSGLPARARAATFTGIFALGLTLGLAPGLGCGGGSQKPSPDRPTQRLTSSSGTGTSAESGEAEREGPFVGASAEASSEEEAYATALAMLKTELFGEGPWAAAINVPVHDPARDYVERESSPSGQPRITIGLMRERVAEILGGIAAAQGDAALDNPELAKEAPPALGDAIRSAYVEMRARMACERRLALLEEACETTVPSDREAELTAIGKEIALRLAYEGGIPLSAQNQPLAPVQVLVERRTPRRQPAVLMGIPVVVVEGGEMVTRDVATTNELGIAMLRFTDGTTWTSAMRVALDRERLLGPIASVWPSMEIPITSRPVSLSRWAIFAKEQVQSQQVRDGVFATRLNEVLRERGAAGQVSLTPDVESTLVGASPQSMPARLPKLASRFAGKVDMLLVVELDSQYASRMGIQRVWYEARGRVDVYNVWTGALLKTVELTVTASGVGEERAARAARVKLAEDIGTALASDAALRLGAAQ